MSPQTAALTEAVVLCGGLGSRLRAVVSDVPKPMAPILGRPFLEYLLEYLAREGVQRVILAAGYKYMVITEHFGASWGGISIDYSIEAEPLGTGGGLRQALGRLDEPAGLVLNGDSLLVTPLAPLARVLRETQAALGMAACWRQDAAEAGICDVESGRLLGFHRGAPGESGLVNAGVYAVRRALFDGVDLPPVFSFEQDFLARQAERIDMRVLTVEGGFIDIGQPHTYAQAQSIVPRALGD